MNKEKTKPKLIIHTVKHTDEVFKYEQWNYSADDKTIRIHGSDDKIHNTPVETWYVDPTVSAEEFQLICEQLEDMRMAQNTPLQTMH